MKRERKKWKDGRIGRMEEWKEGRSKTLGTEEFTFHVSRFTPRFTFHVSRNRVNTFFHKFETCLKLVAEFNIDWIPIPRNTCYL